MELSKVKRECQITKGKRRCSSPPWGRCCWLRSACGGSRLGAGVALLVGGGLRSEFWFNLRGRGRLRFWLTYRVGLGRVSPTPTVEKKQKKCYLCHAAITAMAPSFATRHATAIRWYFFKKPPRHSTMASPWPPFDNTGPNRSNKIFINIMIDLNK